MSAEEARKRGDMREALVLRKEEEALLSKLKVLARENCRREVQAYVDCTNAAGLAVVWSCRESLGEMNKCLGQWTSDEALAETRRQWVEAGRRQDLAWRPDLSKVVGGQP